MAQVAYDFARFETQKRAPKAERAVNLQSVKGGNGKKTGLKKLNAHLTKVMAVTAFFVVAFALILSEAALTECAQQIQVQGNQLVVAQSEYSYLETTLNNSINNDQVELRAKEAGLVKLDESQVTYFRLDNEAQVTVEQSPVQQWLSKMNLFVTHMFALLDP